jgi:hypothetical protein
MWGMRAYTGFVWITVFAVVEAVGSFEILLSDLASEEGLFSTDRIISNDSGKL